MNRSLRTACSLLALAAAGLSAQPVRDTPGYAFITSDIELCRIAKYDAEGKAFWAYDKQVKPIDVWAMPDGAVLIAYLPSPLTKNMGGVRLVDADQKTVFDLPFDDEIMSVQPLENGNFLMAECHYGRITEMDRKGNRIRSFQVATPPSGHKTVRQIRLTPQGTVIAAECYSHKLREYDFTGKVLREIDIRYPYYPVPLTNGNVLVGCWNHPEAQVVEVDPAGKVVWSVKASELPKEMGVLHIAGVARLPSGNTLVSTSVKAGAAPNPRTMLFEITPDKQVVWQMLDKDGSTWLSTVKLLAPPSTQSSARSAATSSPAAKSPAPAAAWSFDGAAEGLTPVGGPLRFIDAGAVPATDGKALALDGSSYLTAPPSDANSLGASYTIEAWIHPTRLAAWNRIVLRWGADNRYAYHLALREGRASLLHGQADGTYVACEGGSVQPDRWQQLVGVADAASKSLRLYLDGRLMATVPFDGTANAAATEPLAIGDSATLPHADIRFAGYLDSVTLWKQPLSDAEIAARFAAHPKSPPPPPVALSAPGEILFAERHPGRDYASHVYANFGYDCGDENYWLHGADGGRLAIFNPATREVRTLIEDAGGAFRDPCVHYDAHKVLFSYRKGGTHHYNLYEINLDGTGLKQLTSGDWDDIEPCYLPDGDIAFCSSRSKRYVLCWLAPVATLHRCNPDGSDIRQLSSGAVTQMTPSVLPDGRILFTLWDYNHRVTTAFKHLWVMNPDGTGIAAYFGNMNWEGGDPAYVDARAIPDSSAVVYVRAGHGSNEHAGRLMRLSVAGGPDNLAQARAFTGEGFRDPYPVSSSEFLAARGNELVVVSDQGKVGTLWRSALMLHEPRLIAARPREPVIPSRVDASKTTGTLFLNNAYIGRHMGGLATGTVKKLLVMEQLPKPANYHGGGSTPLAHGGKWTINRILGTVPVEPDGSASFEVPADRSIFLAALDDRDLLVKEMRSFVTVRPGERASCIGCHEYRTTVAPPAAAPLAARRAPSRIEPIAGVPEILDFPRDVQPILDRGCVACHNPDQRDGGVDLCGDRGPTYSMAYYNLLLHRQVKDTAGLGWAGERNRSGEPLANDAPYEAFSGAAPLMKLLDGSHFGAKLTDQEQRIVRLWLDSATPYAGTYAAYGTGQIGGWWRLNEPTREMANGWPSTQPCTDAINRRCASCHGAGQMPRFVTDAVNIPYNDFEGFMRPTFRLSRHHIFNLTRPERSLALMATLAKSAGGCAEGALPEAKPVPINLATAPKPYVHPVVFTSKDDPDYRAILAHLQAAGARLDEIKRFDMPGFQPRYEYLREMKRYGVLPADFDLKNPPNVDAYELDQKYWRLFWPQPVNPAS